MVVVEENNKKNNKNVEEGKNEESNGTVARYKHVKFIGNYVAMAWVSPPDDAEAWLEIDELCDRGMVIKSTEYDRYGLAPVESVLYVVLGFSNSEQYFANEWNKQAYHRPVLPDRQ